MAGRYAFRCVTPASEIKREYRRLRRRQRAAAAVAAAALPAAAEYNDLSTLFDGRFPLASSRATTTAPCAKNAQNAASANNNNNNRSTERHSSHGTR